MLHFSQTFFPPFPFTLSLSVTRIERKPQITQMKGTIKPCEIK
jgi:hypothetical protein